MMDRLARSAVLARLDRLEGARVVFVDRDGRFEVGDADASLSAEIEVHDPGTWRAVAMGGTVGAGEAYGRGLWSCDDLTSLVRILVRNRSAMTAVEGRTARLRQWSDRLWHRLRGNSRRGSRRNIAAHYDLGNDFFERLLDPTMTYSCAVFQDSSESLEYAQLRKIDQLCRMLELQPSDRLLEIGTGWGGFALHAARSYGCSITTATISRAQYDVARARIRSAGLEDQVEVVLCDYRDLDGRYDKLASIEMVEAVGLDRLEGFFGVCSRLLAPGGRMVMQAITIAENYYEEARRSVDFIQRYIFPGSGLASESVLEHAAHVGGALSFREVEDITASYPPTLRAWGDALREHSDELIELGYDRVLQRLWDFYLSYCEGGFLERSIGDVQVVLEP